MNRERGERILRIRPGESVDEFTTRIADNAPPLTPDLAERLRQLLAIGHEPEAPQQMQQPVQPQAA